MSGGCILGCVEFARQGRLTFIPDWSCEHFATFISKHAPAITVKLFSANLEYHLLVPPGEGVLDPWILADRKSQDDCLVKRAIVEMVVLEIPDAFGGKGEPCLIMST